VGSQAPVMSLFSSPGITCTLAFWRSSAFTRIMREDSDSLESVSSLPSKGLMAS
jgi:hypothetical protein